MSLSRLQPSEELTLYGTFAADDIGVLDNSPFVSKVITYLKLRHWSFTFINGMGLASMFKLTRGKVPCLCIGERMISDSANIISSLEAFVPEAQRLDAKLSSEDKAIALAMRKMVEESFYWCGLMGTAVAMDEGWEVTKAKYHPHLGMLQRLFAGAARSTYVSQYRAQGDGRRPAAEAQEIAKSELDALSTWLGDKAFFMGGDLTTLDLTMYAFLSAMKGELGWYPFCPVRQHMHTKENLMAYTSRVAALLG